MLHPNILAARHRDEALQAIRAHKYERTDSGIVIPSMKIAIGGVFEVAGNDGVYDVCPNLIPTEGLNHIISVALAQGTQKSAFYIALFSGDVTVQATWTGANFVENATEFTNYTGERQEWVNGAVAAGSVSNTASPAVFPITGAGGTVRGIALLEANAKGSVEGVLVAASKLSVAKVMALDEELKAKYTLSATST
ncbi:hypothetical protein [uncultured Arenimonas sp.]|uniref:hypothetical protein n=1 Tax=uncultured Arenimonas sp. TaxID=546226 RepID=UPI0030D8BE6F